MLMYGCEIWVMTGEILKVLEGFHHRAFRRIKGMTTKRVAGGEWEYPLVVASLEASAFHPIQEYIHRRQVTIAAQV